MSVQQFCLRWNNHQPNFISVFSSLLHNETLVDVTLAADGSQLQAHKVVLSACSTYFESLFTSNPCRHPIVILKDVRYSDLKTLVDFMYYGEVNVSQERLPHIIKTAEMLKIKGLAEMSDAASLSKSESKSSSSDTETLTTNVIVNDDGESPWRTSHTQHSLLHRQQVTQSTGASQQQQQQQQQASQQAAHIHSRRTPSPATMSPAARRKRLRKSSTGMPEYPIRKEHYVTDDDFRPGSGSVSAAERTSGEEHSNLEGGPSGASAIHMQHMDPMSSFATASNLTSTISNARIIKDSPSSDTEQPQHETSQESVDEQGSVQHHSIVVKTDSDLDHVSQPMPLDITGSSSSGPSVSQPQSQHSGLSAKSLVTTTMGSKRGRLLIRQPRIKKESDATSSTHASPEPDIASDLTYAHLLRVPPQKIERHASEPTPAGSPHLLSVPTVGSAAGAYLVKQHSHPLLPSQSSSPGPFPLQRQLSHPASTAMTTLTPSPPIVEPTSAPPVTLSSHLTHFIATTLKGAAEELSDPTPSTSRVRTLSPTVLIVPDATPEPLGAIRVKTEELQRSASSPQVKTRDFSLDNPRSSHCPVVRPGPALGCNFCWNTIDAHGRILRRKTKYHCPECQTNLCIVPCFQEYHERQASGADESAGNSSKSTQTSVATLRHFPKTGSI
ncbi:protein tramtrack, alpha isoform isoform X2 [Phlebotomus argentipes]|uniref:protein tramtrack, alpha isoform isoform X2 n=1 Tax=Phlebotomus argentipes TaxID=94469 RepID=UPI002892B497|nr:protein tramtrack, alpha isoform isoform X2 [Phlebotomus argentipes]